MRDNFIAGIFAAVPIVVTAFIIKWIDDKTQVLTEPLFGKPIPVLGIVIALIAIYVLGMGVRSLLGRQLLQFADRLLRRMPVVRPVYEAWKQVSLTPGGKEGMFAKVVLVRVETGAIRVLGFTSGLPLPADPDVFPVFIPSSPNPISGRLFFVPRQDLRFLEMSADEGLKLIVSNGNYLPAGLKTI